MEFTVISDTHGYHSRLQLPAGEVLLHAGDISRRGRENEIKDFLAWFASQDFRYKIFIAGNHDFLFEEEEALAHSLLPEGVIYLNDSGTEINGIKIWGSPVTPRFYDWAFNRDPGEEIMKHWRSIPEDTDVLLTHGPAFSCLDTTIYGNNVGCKDLFQRLKQVRPAFHVCGHIHEAYGAQTREGIHFLNASVLNEGYVLKNPPQKFTFSK